MKLLNLNKELFLSLILFIFVTPLASEDSIDIWKKENLKTNTDKKDSIDVSLEQPESKININLTQPKEINID